MILSVALCIGLFGQTPGPTDADGRTLLSLYESRRAAAGRDASAQIRLALWCEDNGLSAERQKHLALVIARDPNHSLARGLLGMVSYQGKWKRPEDVITAEELDAAAKKLLDEYHEHRAQTPRRADAQAKLAQWCQRNGLKEQALAHYSEVVRLDPARETAWKHLGYKRQADTWVMPEELAARKVEAERQKRADLKWKPRLEKLRESLENGNEAKRAKAREGLAEINDPRAVPMVCRILAGGNEQLQLAAVDVLGQIDGPSASNALASIAVFRESPVVRSLAAQKLTNRDPRDVIGLLINLVRRPYKYTVSKGNGPGTTGELIVDGESFKLRQLYEFTSVDTRTLPFIQNPYQVEMMMGPGTRFMGTGTLMGNGVGLQAGAGVIGDEFRLPRGQPQALNNSPIVNVDTRTLPNLAQGQMPTAATASTPAGSTISTQSVADMIWFTGIQGAIDAARQNESTFSQAMRENTRRNQAVQESLEADIALVEALNRQISQLNDRVLPILRTLTGLSLAAEPTAWKKWWADECGYSNDPTGADTKPRMAAKSALPNPQTVLHASLAAGTSVRTVDGLKAIESIQPGDRVLSQDTTTGLLEFRAVTGKHVSSPSATIRVSFNSGDLTATGILPIWKAGKGWTMARELAGGDQLRVVGGITTVAGIDRAETQPGYSLEVANHGNFFVGETGILVHDFGFVEPVAAPFDQVPSEKPAEHPR